MVRKDLGEWAHGKRPWVILIVTTPVHGPLRGERRHHARGSSPTSPEGATVPKSVSLVPLDNFLAAIGSQIFVVVAIFASMSLLVAERDRGTLSWVASKPVSRGAIWLSKWAAASVVDRDRRRHRAARRDRRPSWPSCTGRSSASVVVIAAVGMRRLGRVRSSRSCSRPRPSSRTRPRSRRSGSRRSSCRGCSRGCCQSMSRPSCRPRSCTWAVGHGRRRRCRVRHADRVGDRGGRTRRLRDVAHGQARAVASGGYAAQRPSTPGRILRPGVRLPGDGVYPISIPAARASSASDSRASSLVADAQTRPMTRLTPTSR